MELYSFPILHIHQLLHLLTNQIESIPIHFQEFHEFFPLILHRPSIPNFLQIKYPNWESKELLLPNLLIPK